MEIVVYQTKIVKGRVVREIKEFFEKINSLTGRQIFFIESNRVSFSRNLLERSFLTFADFKSVSTLLSASKALAREGLKKYPVEYILIKDLPRAKGPGLMIVIIPEEIKETEIGTALLWRQHDMFK